MVWHEIKIGVLCLLPQWRNRKRGTRTTLRALPPSDIRQSGSHYQRPECRLPEADSSPDFPAATGLREESAISGRTYRRRAAEGKVVRRSQRTSRLLRVSAAERPHAPSDVAGRGRRSSGRMTRRRRPHFRAADPNPVRPPRGPLPESATSGARGEPFPMRYRFR